MHVNPRNRIVVFRLSQEEYKNLKHACQLRGARSVSDFTRSEILASVSGEPVGGPVHPAFDRIVHEITELKFTVASLVDGLAGMKAAVDKNRNYEAESL